MNATALAAETQESQTETLVQNSTVQPKGRYLQGGGCSITPYSGYVRVNGHTDAFDDVSELTVELSLLKEISSNCWVEVWSDTATEYNTFHAAYLATYVTVDSGYNYKLEATHTVKNAGITETNYSETNRVYVY